MAQVILEVLPQNGLVDEELSISIAELTPKQEIVVCAETKAKDGTLWVSSASFQADARGKVDLQKQAPIAGSYGGIDTMGLIWSMRPQEGTLESYQLPSAGMEIVFSVEVEGEKVAEQQVHRALIKDNIQCLVIEEEGLVGVLYVPEASSQPRPAVITLTGSGGGLSETRAKLLASHGYVTFALVYFGHPGTPRDLEAIPLEYFEKGVAWLKKRPEVCPQQIGLWGVSRGGELALLLGSLCPDLVQAIVAYVPSSIVFGSLKDPRRAAWTYRGEPALPPAPFRDESHLDEHLGLSAEHPIHLRQAVLSVLEPFPETSAIPVEKITCPLLVFGTEDDQMWPSGLFAQQIRERLKGNSHSTVVLYPKTGHSLAPPYVPVTGTISFHPIDHRWFEFGGEPRHNAQAAQDAWQQTLAFFSRVFYNSSK